VTRCRCRAASAKTTTSDITVGDYTFHLNQAGDPSNPAIVFLHGAGPGATGLSNWEDVLNELGSQYFCLAPDVIGYGDSTHPNPPPQGIVAFTELRIDAILGLLDELRIEKATFVGNSMGGMWSLGIVRRAPHRVHRIVLMGSGGAPIPPGAQIPTLIGFYADPTTESMAKLLKAFVYDPEMFGDELDNIAAARRPEQSDPTSSVHTRRPSTRPSHAPARVP
jgi:2-hydroxymuconate-semialdehyde hydrolase